MKKTRIKQPVTPDLTGIEVDMLLADIQLITINEQKILARKNQEIAAIEQRYAPALAAIDSDRKEKSDLLHRWSATHRHHFGNKKSIESVFGKFGFRTGQPQVQPLSKKWPWKSILRTLVAARFTGWIRIKREVDKERILAVHARSSDAKKFKLVCALEKAGMKIVQEETFFIEPALEQPEARTTNKTPVALPLLLLFVLFVPFCSPPCSAQALTCARDCAQRITITIPATNGLHYTLVRRDAGRRDTIAQAMATNTGPLTFTVPTTEPAAWFAVSVQLPRRVPDDISATHDPRGNYTFTAVTEADYAFTTTNAVWIVTAPGLAPSILDANAVLVIQLPATTTALFTPKP